MKHKLIRHTDPFLREKLEEFDFENPPMDPNTIAETLYDLMVEYKGLGLSAIQIGWPYRVFVMHSNPKIVCFNPEIIETSDDHIVMEEGCLTFPNLFVKIRRPAWVKTKFFNEKGEEQTETFTGITGRCFLHEYDHVEGVLFVDRASRIALDRAKKQKKMIERKKKNQPTVKNIKTSE